MQLPKHSEILLVTVEVQKLALKRLFTCFNVQVKNKVVELVRNLTGLYRIVGGSRSWKVRWKLCWNNWTT